MSVNYLPAPPMNNERPQAKFPEKINKSWPLVQTTEDGDCFSPFGFERDRFSSSDVQSKLSEPTSVTSMDEVILESRGQIPLLLDLLRRKRFDVGLEHHTNGTFQGFIFLMQILTEDEGYLLDTLLSLCSDLNVLYDATRKIWRNWVEPSKTSNEFKET